MTTPCLVFSIGDERYALDVAAVERIVPAAATTPLPNAPEAVLGLLNIAGDVMPVLDLRRRFGFPPRDMELTDRFIVTRATGRPLALLVDATEGVVELTPRAVAAAAADSGATTTVATLSGSIVLIQNIEAFAAVAEAALACGTQDQKVGGRE